VSLRLRLRPYRLPLCRPWASARETIAERRGWLVVASGDGLSGYGDCAPLPAAGTETERDALRRLQAWCEQAQTATEPDLLAALLRAAPMPTPAADAAVETALLDLQARRTGVPLRRLLEREPPLGEGPGNGVSIRAAARVRVNAMLGAAATVTDAALDQAIAAGFRVIKLKLGTADWPLELARLRRAAARLPTGIALRLDANGAWSPAQARMALEDLQALHDGGAVIESLEEPCHAADDRLLGALQQQVSFALALDESLSRRRPLDPQRLPVRRLVLKPAAVGGLRPTLELARRAAAAGRDVVLTTVIESAAGLWATAQLAAVLPAPLAHGLATAEWLAADLGAPPVVDNGLMTLPEIAGSGFAPAAEHSA